MFRDLRFALRTLRRAPGFALVVVLTLALAVGVNSAVFSAVEAVLLRPLPFHDADRLVVGWSQQPGGGSELDLSPPDFRAWRDGNGVFESMAAVPRANPKSTMVVDGHGEEITAVPVSGEFFGVLGIHAERGRVIIASDDQVGAAPVAVISEEFWRSRFAGDPGVLGRVLRIDDQAFTVVGVLPHGSSFPARSDVWLPLSTALPQQVNDRTIGFLMIVARLKPNVAVPAATHGLGDLVARLAASQGGPRTEAALMPLRRFVLGDARVAVWTLFGAVSLVLVLATANIAGLLLVRATARRGEMAVRVALGASLSRIARQMLAESAVLGVLGCGVGLALAAPALRVLIHLAPGELPRLSDARLDLAALTFAIGLTVAAAVVFGLAPVFTLGSPTSLEAIRSGMRGTASPGARRAFRALVIGELAVAVVLLVGAGLLTRSFASLNRVDLGFDPHQLISMQLPLPPSRYLGPVQQRAFLHALLPSIQNVPGVVSSAAVLLRPLEGKIGYDFPVRLDGQDSTAAARNPLVNYEAVSARYFATMRIPLTLGRDFSPADGSDAPLVAVVSAAVARQFWPGQNPLGQRMRLPTPGRPGSDWTTVIGVAGDAHYRDVRNASLDVYVPMDQSAFVPTFLVVRGQGSAISLIPALRRQIAALDATTPVASVATMDDQFRHELAQPRFMTTLVGLFAALALLLATIGLYSLQSYLVAQRTREIGIRMALGATASAVRGNVLRQALIMASGGILLGAIPAWIGARAISQLLYSVKSADPFTFVGVAAVLIGISLVAAYVPARRATSVDPLLAMRDDRQ